MKFGYNNSSSLVIKGEGINIYCITLHVICCTHSNAESDWDYLSLLCSLFSLCKDNIIVVIKLCRSFSFSVGIPGLVLLCLLSPLSCPLKPQLVEVDGNPS